ncbi:efflux RND transporter periplasmic adaptor subunit [Meridianimarinicoccus sp. RP-17]|uniref:efflux RND transporter periplasmic adaptor subunit n=1 Tax=Meridianimarinicoccus zhengii TaxID=2056810 RepID=UPI000DAB618B|nr:efflux RND transporter periplasmic adaptor subunit [Phycocomes zhengii]
MADDLTERVSRTLREGSGRRVPSVVAAIALVGALLAVATLAFLGTGQSSGGEGYVTEAVTRGSFTVTVTATGTVEPTNRVEISSELSGAIATVNVDFNDSVDVGTVLATLDTRRLEAQIAIARASLETTEARVAVAEASLDLARSDFEIARTLEGRGVTSHQALAARDAALSRAEAELRAAEADRALAAATLELHQADLDNACICSPMRGVVLTRAVDPGQVVAASLAAPVLFTLAEDLREMQLQVAIDEADIGRVAVGDRASFTVDAYENRRFAAVFSELRFAAEIVNGVVTYKAILDVDNTDMLLRPGMTATAEIVVAEVTDALVVPNAAVRFSPPARAAGPDGDRPSGLLGILVPSVPEPRAQTTGRTVWILMEDQPVKVEILPGETDGMLTQVLEGSLGEGDLVITGASDG